MKPNHFRALAIVLAGAIIGLGAGVSPRAIAAEQAKPKITDEAAAALLHMGQTLKVDKLSFKAKTIRVYSEADGTPLHIFHSISVVTSRPDHVAAEVTGDDGTNKLYYDGKGMTLYSQQANKYTILPPPTENAPTEAMMNDAMNHFGIDFPLADFFAEAPNKAFLSGVTSGRLINTVTVDGQEYQHLFFYQPPGIGLELWVEKSDRALPKRLIVTYYKLPDSPNFIAEFSDWNLNAQPADADFTFTPPAGAEKVDAKMLVKAGQKSGGKQ